MASNNSGIEEGAYQDITQHEIEALKTKFNLADAHTHQRQSFSQKDIIARLPSLWYEAERRTQSEMEQRFISAFFGLQRQPTVLKKERIMLFYAASIAMFVAGNYLMKKKMSVSLIEPCFDNLYDLLKNLDVQVRPLQEEWLHDCDNIRAYLETYVDTDAICLVDPNNPTGFSLLSHGRRGFEELIRFCKEANKLLLLDFSFASFALMDDRIGRFDLYELLEESGVRYIAIEDTGKTWPIQDAKCALMTASDEIYQEVYDLHTAVLLNVSPFILNILSEYLLDTDEDGFASVRELLECNREVVRKALDGSLLELCESKTKVSVAWCRIKAPLIRATDLQRFVLCHSGVYVLPGTYFFWSNREKGEQYVRIALARDRRMFEAAIKHLRGALDAYGRR